MKIQIPMKDIDKIYNMRIFHELYKEGKTNINDLIEEFEVRGFKPELFTEKYFLNFVIGLCEQQANKKTKITIKEAKDFLDKKIKEGKLKRWGDEGLIVTDAFLKFKDAWFKAEKGEIEISIIKLKNEKEEKHGIFELSCPYCNSKIKKELEGGVSITCSECKKVFKTITGVVKRVDIKHSFYTPDSVYLRLNVNGKENIVAFTTNHNFSISSGDTVTVIMRKRGLLTKRFHVYSIADWDIRSLFIVDSIQMIS